MTDSIQTMASELGLTKKQINIEVKTFLEAQGEDMCFNALILMGRTIRKAQNDGVHSGPSIRSWRWATKKVLVNVEMQDYTERQQQESEQAKTASEASRKKGYMPNKETILAQLEDLIDKAEISQQEYEWGLKGLAAVHGYVEMAKDLPEQDEIPL